MPVVKDGRTKKEKVRCDPEEGIIVERAHYKYCRSNHDNNDFVREFLDAHSLDPGSYIVGVKKGRIMISLESWNKLKAYASNM